MAGPNLKPEGTPGVRNYLRPTLIPNSDQPYIKNGVLSNRSPQGFAQSYPTADGTTLMYPTENFTYVVDRGLIKSFYFGEPYEVQTSLYTKMVADGMPVTS